jgi:hypothetical protein
MMEGPWLGLGIMVVMIVGVTGWIIWTVRKDKDVDVGKEK